MNNVVKVIGQADFSDLTSGIDKAKVGLGDLEEKAESSGRGLETASGAADTSATKFSTLAGAMGDVAGGLGLIGLGGFSDDLEKVAPALMLVAGASDLVAVGTEVMNAAWLASPITWIVLGIAGLAAGLVIAYEKSETFRNIVNGAFDDVKRVAGGVVDFFTDDIPAAFHTVENIAKNWTLPGLVITHFDDIENVAGKTVDFVKSIPTRIVSVFKDAPHLLEEAGEDVVEGLWEGIESKGEWLYDKISGWVSDHIPSPVKKVLGIFSPSKVMRDLAIWIPEGIAAGIDDGGPKVDEAWTKILDRLKTRSSDLRSEFDQVRQTVADAFSGTGIFSSATNALDLTGQLNHQLAANNLAQMAIDTLKQAGIDGDFLTQVASTGNTNLLISLAQDPQLAKVDQDLFDKVQTSSDALGLSTAQAAEDQGKNIADSLKELRELKDYVKTQLASDIAAKVPTPVVTVSDPTGLASVSVGQKLTSHIDAYNRAVGK